MLWLAEIHMNPQRSLLSAPLTVASAIAARTSRIKIGTAVQILPLGHPLRLAEETATIDQISNGRLIFGVGRSAFPRAYQAYGISYQESVERFAESLDIIKKAWTEPMCSHRGRYYEFDNFTLVPRPVQTPHPPIRIAASQADTYSRDRRARLSAVFGGAREPADRAAARTPEPIARPGRAAGHPGKGELYLQVPIYVGETARRPSREAEAGMMQFSTYRTDLVRGPLTYEQVRHEKGIVGTPDMVAARLAELQETAGIDGVSAEINPGSLLSHDQVMRSLRLYCQEVMPRFK